MVLSYMEVPSDTHCCAIQLHLVFNSLNQAIQGKLDIDVGLVASLIQLIAKVSLDRVDQFLHEVPLYQLVLIQHLC